MEYQSKTVVSRIIKDVFYVSIDIVKLFFFLINWNEISWIVRVGNKSLCKEKQYKIRHKVWFIHSI